MKNKLEKLKELQNYKYVTISGLNEGEKKFLPSLFLQKSVVIVNDEETLKNYKTQLTSLNKKVIDLTTPLPLLISLGE